MTYADEPSEPEMTRIGLTVGVGVGDGVGVGLGDGVGDGDGTGVDGAGVGDGVGAAVETYEVVYMIWIMLGLHQYVLP